MVSIAASAGQVVFVPRNSNSYFYESVPCTAARADNYGGLQFSVQGPAGGQLSVELQTSSDCNNRETWRSHFAIISNLNGRRQLVSLPWSSFDNNPNLDVVTGIVWAGFSSFNQQWSVGNVTLICGIIPGATGPSMSLPFLACHERLPLTRLQGLTKG
jgi:hypothetical protein